MCIYIYIKGCGTQPGLGELKHEGLLLRQEQVYKVYKGKKPKYSSQQVGWFDVHIPADPFCGLYSLWL